MYIPLFISAKLIKPKESPKNNSFSGFIADIIFEDYLITLTYRERRFNLNVYDIKTIFYDLHAVEFVTKLLYKILCKAPLVEEQFFIV